MSRLTDLLKGQQIDLDAVSQHLDSLSNQERVAQVRAVPGSQQRRLFQSAAGWRPLSLADLVPPSTAEESFVRHLGKNSLPLFSHFEKRFARPETNQEVLWGYNFSALMGLIGPGHFVLREGPDAGELQVDYYALPERVIGDAPGLKPNDRGISALVYGNMIDVLRGISTHVSVGRAIKRGKETNNYFLLCREA